MKSFWRWVESEFDQGGFWTGRGGKGASGILPICQATAKVGLNLRSRAVDSLVGGKNNVHIECWGTIGGAINEGKSPLDSAKHEVWEETGFTGPYIKIVPGFVFTKGSFTYSNFIAVVPVEFEFAPQTGAFWESVGLEWVNYEDIVGKSSYGSHPMHDGLPMLLNNSKDIIEKILAEIKPEQQPTTAIVRKPTKPKLNQPEPPAQ